jgi:hypothetical protein
MSCYMINGTAGHANIQSKTGLFQQMHDGVIVFRSDSQSTRIRQNDEFTSIVDNEAAVFVTEKVKLLNKGYVNSIDPPVPIALKDLLPHELRIRKRSIDLGRKPATFYTHKIRYSQASLYKEFSFLDDYSYSLLKVYKRYIKPSRHYSKVITEMPETDFETLRKERIFIDRTIFGRLINALPYPNRLQFMLFCIEEFKEADLRKIHFSKATPFLKKFVGNGIIDMGKYINASVNILIEQQELFGDFKKISFQDESDRLIALDPKNRWTKTSSNNIYSQSLLFDELFNMASDFDKLFTEIDYKNKANDVFEFEKIFSKRPWPVDLNTENL